MDFMLDSYDETVRPILSKGDEYKDKIVLIITFFDNCSHNNKNVAK